jgi:hypothetical protein
MPKRATVADDNVHLLIPEEPAFGTPKWRPTKVHPLADLFPLLAPDDLQALADDINEHGLINPIVVGPDGTLIDGRNRLKACEMAGVAPVFELLEDVDTEAFIWSVNAKRRQMTKSQVAMVAAMGLSTASIESTGGRPNEGKGNAAKAAGVSPQRLSLALLVKQHAADLAQLVIDGSITLDAAYEQAKAGKKAAEWQNRRPAPSARSGA